MSDLTRLDILVNGGYICPLCKTVMRHPPRDWNICPNRECFVEFGYNAAQYADDGTLMYARDMGPHPKEPE